MMKRRQTIICLIAFTITLGCISRVQAESVTYTIFSVPSSLHTYALGINDKGQIVGYYADAVGTYGFTLAGADLNTIDVPDNPPVPQALQGSHETDPSVVCHWDGSMFQYFTFEDENFNSIDPIGLPITRAHDISNTGRIVGRSGSRGFLLNNRKINTFGVPDTYKTFANGINESGDIVGWYMDGEKYRGFLFDGNVFSMIDVPGSNATYAYGISDSGLITGYYTNDSGSHGFLLQDGKIIKIDFPGARHTIAYGVNDSGDIVGCYNNDMGRRGFLYSKGEFYTINAPGAISTYAYGINDSGYIVGYCYSKATGKYRGFVATPDDVAPEAASLENITTE